jgi:hypothetical protein
MTKPCLKQAALFVSLVLMTTLYTGGRAADLPEQPMQQPYETMISFGDEYTSTIEWYDVVLTVKVKGRQFLFVPAGAICCSIALHYPD